MQPELLAAQVTAFEDNVGVKVTVHPDPSCPCDAIEIAADVLVIETEALAGAGSEL